MRRMRRLWKKPVLLRADTGRPLLTPNEIRNLPQGRELLSLAGLRPIVADKLRYYDDPEFAGSFDPVAVTMNIGPPPGV
jgi:type IV secretory pathway TraG/TraD family ATPase VirD4